MVAEREEKSAAQVHILSRRSEYNDNEFPLDNNGIVDIRILQKRYGGLIRHIAIERGVASEIEEVIQETMWRVYKNQVNYRGETLRAWVVRIATNLCKDILKHRRFLRRRDGIRVVSHSRDITDIPEVIEKVDGVDIEGNYLDEERNSQIRRVLSQLDEADRILLEVVYLADGGKISLNEAAALYKMPVESIKTRIFRARRRARALFIQHGFSSTGEMDASESFPR